jgi:pimeloyl-ACP methyl ester carboxylesterase
MIQLVLIPGLACNAVMWRSQMPVLPAQLRTRITDVHTRSDTIEDMARTLLDDCPGDLLLCGASMGSIVAMEAVRQAPQRVKGMALLGSNARPETDDMRKLREMAIALFESGRAAEVLRANVPLAFHARQASNSELVRTYIEFILEAGPAQLVRQNRALMSRPDARLHLASVACPVLVMCGDSDQLTPPENAREIAALIPSASLLMVPECGHMLTMERPDLVNAGLLQWLQQFAPAA